MATALVTAVEYQYPKGETFDQRRLRKFGTLSFSNANYFTGGLAIPFPPARTTNIVPVDVRIKSLKGSGFIYEWVIADLWPQNTAIVQGWQITDKNGNLQLCTTNGTTNNTAEPTWAIPTNANPNPTTADGSAVWTCQGPGPSLGTVRILTGAAAQSPLTEATSASAVPSLVQTDNIEYIAEYLRG
jgi:hypothetical protein